LQDVFPKGNNDATIYIEASIFATKEIVDAIKALKENEKFGTQWNCICCKNKA